MEVEIGRGKKARRAYGFDDIAIVPSRRRAIPTTSTSLGRSATTASSCRCSRARWTASCRPTTAGIIGTLGGLAVLNLEGIFTPLRGCGRAARADRRRCPRRSRPARCRRSTREPVKEELIAAADPRDQGRGRRLRCVADAAARARYYEIALDAGLDILVIQGTVVSGEHVSDDERAAEPQGVHPDARHAGRSSAAAPPTTRVCT